MSFLGVILTGIAAPIAWPKSTLDLDPEYFEFCRIQSILDRILASSRILCDEILGRALSLECHENMTHTKYEIQRTICDI